MKSKQLSNVLIKILGFSFCLYAIPSFISGIFLWSSSLSISQAANTHVGLTTFRLFSYVVGAVVQVIIGMVVIASSHKIAGMFFKNDNE